MADLVGHSAPAWIYADHRYHSDGDEDSGDAADEVEPGQPLEAGHKDHGDHAGQADRHSKVEGRQAVDTCRSSTTFIKRLSQMASCFRYQSWQHRDSILHFTFLDAWQCSLL